jgi:hypothetical protein
MSFYQKLLELEAEIIAENSRASAALEKQTQLSGDCIFLLNSVENEIGMRLGNKTGANWTGWLSFRRPQSLLICRGRAFTEGGFFPVYRAGLDNLAGLSTIAEALRGFDVTPPGEMDHLLLNFMHDKDTRVMLWYAENTAAYRPIFEANIEDEPVHQLHEAIAEACKWIINRPKSMTLIDYLKQLEASA